MDRINIELNAIIFDKKAATFILRKNLPRAANLLPSKFVLKYERPTAVSKAKFKARLVCGVHEQTIVYWRPWGNVFTSSAIYHKSNGSGGGITTLKGELSFRAIKTNKPLWQWGNKPLCTKTSIKLNWSCNIASNKHAGLHKYGLKSNGLSVILPTPVSKQIYAVPTSQTSWH